MKNDLGTSFIWPLVFAIFGVAALSTAIILVPSMARTYADERGAAAMPCQQATAAPAPAPPRAETEPAQAAPQAEPAQAAPQVEPVPAAPQTEPAQAAPAVVPAEPASATGPWTIALNPGDYALEGDAEAAIDAISAVLARDPKAKVVLTGVNHPAKSSRRAKRAAEVVKEKITADVGVSATQVETTGAQDPGVEGLVVRAELSGGAR